MNQYSDKSKVDYHSIKEYSLGELINPLIPVITKDIKEEPNHIHNITMVLNLSDKEWNIEISLTYGDNE